MLLPTLEPITGLVDQQEINGIRQTFFEYVGIGCFCLMSGACLGFVFTAVVRVSASLQHVSFDTHLKTIPKSGMRPGSLRLRLGGRRCRCCFHRDLSRLQDSTLSPCSITENPNIFPRFNRQPSYKITDKNNGALQSEAQLSGC